jgi:hypothetical protein
MTALSFFFGVAFEEGRKGVQMFRDRQSSLPTIPGWTQAGPGTRAEAFPTASYTVEYVNRSGSGANRTPKNFQV